MGFYAPAQIVRDAREHGVPVRPVDVNFSLWDCTLEDPDCHPGEGRDPLIRRQVVSDGTSTVQQHSDAETGSTMDPGLRRDDNRRALRLGLRQIKGLAEADAERLVAARGSGYADARDLWRRSGLGRAALERLAAADALRSLEARPPPRAVGAEGARRRAAAAVRRKKNLSPARKQPLPPGEGWVRGEKAVGAAPSPFPLPCGEGT